MSSAVSIGGQIRRLRESAGLQAAQLAAALGVDPSAVSNIEHGKRSVKASELAVIADFLGVSQLAILEPDSLLARLPVAARADGASVEGSVMARLTAMAELHHVLADGGHPSRRIRSAPANENPEGWLDRANTLARWASERFRGVTVADDPFTSLVEAIERELGIDVLVDSFGDVSLVGASITDPEFSLIAVSSDQPRPRALFTLAHELGHVLNADGATLNIDNDLRASTDRERLANAFAAALLMPEAHLRRTVASNGLGPDSLARMLVEFGVSYESLVFRLHNMQCVNAAGRDRLRSVGWTGLLARVEDEDLRRALLAARGSRPERRPPLLLASRCLRGLLDGIVGAAPLAGLLDVPRDDLISAISTFELSDAFELDRTPSVQDAPEEVLLSFDGTTWTPN